MRLVIIATEFDSTPEAWKVLHQRGWTKVVDNSTIPNGRRQVQSNRHTTPLIDLDLEEWEYE